MMSKHFSRADIDSLEQRFRANLINSLSGYKSANLVVTANQEGAHNAAIISSVVHLGANPPLLGMVMRPHTVRRDTVENIQATGVYTINHVPSNLIDKAHQTSARYEADQSELTETGLNAEYLDGFSCPYVSECPIKLGMRFVETLPITHNNTLFVIGTVEHAYVPEDAIKPDGLVDLSAANISCISGLDTYSLPKPLARFSYAKVDQALEKLPL